MRTSFPPALLSLEVKQFEQMWSELLIHMYSDVCVKVTSWSPSHVRQVWVNLLIPVAALETPEHILDNKTVVLPWLVKFSIFQTLFFFGISDVWTLCWKGLEEVILHEIFCGAYSVELNNIKTQQQLCLFVWSIFGQSFFPLEIFQPWNDPWVCKR